MIDSHQFQPETQTSRDQRELERRVSIIYSDYDEGRVDEDDEELLLNREQHIHYLHRGLGALPAGFIALDASRAWICYWILHSLALLEAPLPETPTRESIIAFLASCQHPEGGFGGGPYQLPHLAPTYAAVGALVTLGGADALSVIDRPRLHSYLLRMCIPPERGGGMTMHEGGEVDVRGCYCAMAACHMLCLDKEAVAEACSMVDYVGRCQSHEGGIGGEPWNEAHGGYAFCGLAAVALLGRPAEALDLRALLRWAAQRQGAMEGGFMGRTNKLVDGCYSLWQGGVFPILHGLLVGPQGLALPTAAVSGGAPAVPLSQQVGGGGSATERHDSARSIGILQERRQQQLQEEEEEQEEAQQQEAAGQRQGQGRVEESAEEVADRLADLLLSGGTDWVASLPALPPEAAAEQQVAQLQQRLDELVGASLVAEDRLTEAVEQRRPGQEVDELKQEVVDLVEQSADVQKALDLTTSHLGFTRTSAAALLSQTPDASSCGGASDSGDDGGSEGRRQQLCNAKALQLWLLKCCQGTRGGLRDKPGKAPDYYHTCYCLSGLSSSQDYSGITLGGPGNRLRQADPLCNVVEDKVAAAIAFFS